MKVKSQKPEINILSARSLYDIAIWEEIRTSVRRKLDTLVQTVRIEISKDASLAEFQGKEPVPPQLIGLLEHRADGWLQRLYMVCCEAYMNGEKSTSQAFNLSVWFFCLEPFILDGKDDILNYDGQGLLQLLLLAVGSSKEKRRLLKVDQKNSCLAIRAKLWKAWSDKLHLPIAEEAVAAMSNPTAVGANRKEDAPGPGNPASPPTLGREFPKLSPLPEKRSSASPPLKAVPGLNLGSNVLETTWDSIKISFLGDERVQILAGTNTETRNYAEFGFEDGRSGKPNQAWEVLKKIAENHGILANSREAGLPWPKVEKAVQEIRKTLRSHFGIPVDPLPFVRGVGYQACLKIDCSPSFFT